MLLWVAISLLLAAESKAPLIEVLESARHVRVSAPLPPMLAKVADGGVEENAAAPHLSLHLIDPESGKPGPAMFGRYARRDGQLVFTPQFPLVFGLRYQAVCHQAKGPRLVAEYRVPPRPPSQPTTLQAIYPSSDLLPANVLKFYFHFSQPMREGKAIFDQIRIVDKQGTTIPDPWRHTELWTPDARRFTLWIHPGRIKKGVNLRVEFGPVLQPDSEYTLVLSPDVLDAFGRPLGKEYRKTFRTIAEDAERPLPQDWTVTAPGTGTRAPLQIQFVEPLDHGLLGRALLVLDASGTQIAGHGKVGPGELSWSFVPRQPWTRGEYQLTIDDELEDLAGNTPGRVFDRDLDKPDGAAGTLSLRFQVQD